MKENYSRKSVRKVAFIAAMRNLKEVIEKATIKMNGLICAFFGHVPVSKYCETDIAVFTKVCSMCGEPLGLPEIWLDAPPPPAKRTNDKLREDQLKSWRRYVEIRKQKLKKLYP